MKVKDLIEMDVDIEIYDNRTDGIDISFVGPITLTKTGEEYFKEILEYEIKLHKEEKYAIVICTDEEPKVKWRTKFEKAQEFFYCCAGYCSAKDYDKWFKEEK